MAEKDTVEDPTLTAVWSVRIPVVCSFCEIEGHSRRNHRDCTAAVFKACCAAGQAILRQLAPLPEQIANLLDSVLVYLPYKWHRIEKQTLLTGDAKWDRVASSYIIKIMHQVVYNHSFQILKSVVDLNSLRSRDHPFSSFISRVLCSHRQGSTSMPYG